MSTPTFCVRVGDAPEIEAFLGQRLHEHNAAAINRFDGESFSAVQESADGVIGAGICGYTWAGLCFITYLWVDERQRGTGIGSRLLAAAERHGAERGCAQVLLYTHSFQAPGFYRAHGYTPVAEVPDHPIGYSSIFFAKRLDGRLRLA
jgi:ribosomal protein S18 acetylase RimI-like enzyme